MLDDLDCILELLQPNVWWFWVIFRFLFQVKSPNFPCFVDGKTCRCDGGCFLNSELPSHWRFDLGSWHMSPSLKLTASLALNLWLGLEHEMSPFFLGGRPIFWWVKPLKLKGGGPLPEIRPRKKNLSQEKLRFYNLVGGFNPFEKY